ncbi:replication restart helicase PriA [Helicobacter sp. T3_23-1059]
MTYYLISPFGVKSPPFTYKAKSNYEKGALVEIDLREKKMLGVVLAVVAKPSFECKEVVGQKGYFDSRQVELAEFVAYYYYGGIGEAYNLMQPHYFSDGNFSNSSLGNHCIDSLDFEGSQTLKSSSPPKSSENSTSTTSNTRIVAKNGGKDFRENNNSPSIAEGARGRVESSLESSLDSNTKSSLLNLPSASRGNPQTKIYHIEVAQASVSQSQLKNRDISLTLNMTNNAQCAKSDKNDAKIDCHAQQVGLAMTELANDYHEFATFVQVANSSNDGAKNILESNNDNTACHTEVFMPKVSKNPYFFNLNPLSDAQKSALDFVSDKPISLLFGDTGSGKSEIYFHLIASMLNQGKSALFLMPEISLTPQIESRLKNAFGNLVGIWHSKVSQKSKKEILAKLESSELKIIAGARSALFLPLQNLGLIIIDEEHDDAYKSFQNPRYNARDCAMYLVKKCGIQVALGSATPSLTTYYLAKKGGYLYRLKGVFFENATKQYMFENSPTSLTSNLFSHIKSTIKSKKQAIIFVPTRANFKALLCQECGYGFACPFCSVNMSLHIKKNCLVCHYCGYAQIIPKSCPKCSSQHLATKRVGTQQIADELQNAFVESKKAGEIFNNVKIGIFDKDHITTSSKLNTTLKSFKNGEIDILVGTQMLSKGHDYHNVELAVVLGIDYVLNGGDFRSFERGISLLHQIAGRAGRKSSGKVFIQSLQTQWIKGFLGDYEEFLEWEEKRRSKNYPPFKKLVMIHCAHKRQEKAKEQMQEMLPILKTQKKIHIIGYGSNAIERIAGKWRFHILLNGDKISDILEALNALQNQAKIHNDKPQKWVKSTQKSNQDSQNKNTHSQKALVIDKRLEVDIDCLDTL